MTPRTDKEKTPERPKEDESEEMIQSPLTIGSVTQRTVGSSKKSMATVYDHVVGIMPNGKPLNVVTHGDHIKVILPPPVSENTKKRG